MLPADDTGLSRLYGEPLLNAEEPGGAPNERPPVAGEDAPGGHHSSADESERRSTIEIWQEQAPLEEDVAELSAGYHSAPLESSEFCASSLDEHSRIEQPSETQRQPQQQQQQFAAAPYEPLPWRERGDTWTRIPRGSLGLLLQSANDVPLGEAVRLICDMAIEQAAYGSALPLPHLLTILCLLLGKTTSIPDAVTYILGSAAANLVWGAGVYFGGGMDGISTAAVAEEKWHVCWKQLVKCCCVVLWFFVLATAVVAFIVIGTGAPFLWWDTSLDLVPDAAATVMWLIVGGLFGEALFETFQRFLAYQGYIVPQLTAGIGISILHCTGLLLVYRREMLTPIAAADLAAAAGLSRGLSLGVYVALNKYDLGWQSGVRVRLYQRERQGPRQRRVPLTTTGSFPSNGLRRSRRASTRRPSGPLEKPSSPATREPARKRFRFRDVHSAEDGPLASRLSVSGGVPPSEFDAAQTAPEPDPVDKPRLEGTEEAGTNQSRTQAQTSFASQPSLFEARRLSRRVAAGFDTSPVSQPRRSQRTRTVLSVRSVSVDNRLILDGLCLPTTRSLRAYWRAELPKQLRETAMFLRLGLPSALVLSQEWLVFELLVILSSGISPGAVVLLGLVTALAAEFQGLAAGIVRSVGEHVRFLLALGSRDKAQRVFQAAAVLVFLVFSGITSAMAACAYIIHEWYPTMLLEERIKPLTVLLVVLTLLAFDAAAAVVAGTLWPCGLVTAAFTLEAFLLGVLLPLLACLGIFAYDFDAISVLQLEMGVLAVYTIAATYYLVRYSALYRPGAWMEPGYLPGFQLLRARRGPSECRAILSVLFADVAEHYRSLVNHRSLLETSRSGTIDEYLREEVPQLS